jgi:DNA (cytosine-5)-methyltransferase 1
MGRWANRPCDSITLTTVSFEQSPAAAGGLRVVSLFSGIGGLDLGLTRAGHRVLEMCESWTPARRVLASHFHDVPVAADVRSYEPDTPYDVLAAGFPCTDLSHAGAKAGIFGEASGLVRHAFRIAEETHPEWIVLENVPNLLLLHKGAGIAHIVSELERLGYRWAYRTVDTRFTGLPQRRSRVLIVASLHHDPQHALFAQNAEEPTEPEDGVPSGFYWTEGRQGIGLVRGAVPTLKGGSTLGLPSTPAVWFPDAEEGCRFVTPSVEDGEALQGFERGWTKPALQDGGPDLRWKLVGNAVPVDVGRWVGTTLIERAPTELVDVVELAAGHRWPKAAWGRDGHVWTATISKWPVVADVQTLGSVVEPRTAKPLSYRATSGFLSRLDEADRDYDLRFYSDLERHQQHMIVDFPSLTASSTTPTSRTQDAALTAKLVEAGVDFERQTRPVDTERARYPIVLRAAKIAVEYRRCFWFDCPDHNTSGTLDRDRWAPKIAKNVERSASHRAAIAEHGWTVRVVWEHDDMVQQARVLASLVGRRQSNRPVMSSHPTTVAT